MGYPIIVRAILERIPKVVRETPMARAIHRKGGSRIEIQEVGIGGTLPKPILSLEGIKSGCSLQLQNLITKLRDTKGTTDEDEAQDALIDYIESALGETIQQAYPDEWEAALNGENPTFEIDLGADVVTLELGLCGSGIGGEPTALQLELEALVNAVNANPSVANAMNLFAFVEEHTGETIEEILGTTWEELIEDGQTRSVEIPVVGVLLVLTLGGTLQSTTNCRNLDTTIYRWPEHDWEIDPIVISDHILLPIQLGIQHEYTVYQRARHTIHLEDAEVVWIPTTVLHWPYSTIIGNARVDNVVGTTDYRAWMRQKGWWKTRCQVQIHHINGPVDHSYEATVSAPFPLAAFQLTERVVPEYSSQFPTSLTTEDPDVPPFISGGAVQPGDTWPAERYGGSGFLHGQGRELSFRSTFPNAAGSFTSTILMPEVGASVALPSESEAIEAAIDNFQSKVDTYTSNAHASAPSVSFDQTTQEVTVEFMSNQEAFYLNWPQCAFFNADRWNFMIGAYVQYADRELSTVGSTDLPITYNGLSRTNSGTWFADVWGRRIEQNDLTAIMVPGQYTQIFPIAAGDYAPFVAAGEVVSQRPCPTDARCITPGPP